MIKAGKQSDNRQFTTPDFMAHVVKYFDINGPDL